MSEFKRGITNEFVKALGELAAAGGWWRDVLIDNSLAIFLRNECLNVYWQGQSIFKIAYLRGQFRVSTHAKYLLDPSLSEQVPFDGGVFNLRDLAPRALIEKYERATLNKLKRGAEIYANDEKRGVHAIATGNPSVVDIEIAFSARGLEGLGHQPRADIAAFETDGDAVKLTFWEAKLFWNSELRARAEKVPVLRQVRKYQLMLSAHRQAILDSYRRVASNLVALADMSEGKRTVNHAVRAVSEKPETLTMSDPPEVGLIIYGFDAAQRDDKLWQSHLKKLTDAAGMHRVIARGQAKGLRI